MIFIGHGMDKTVVEVLSKLISLQLADVWPRKDLPNLFDSVNQYVPNTGVVYWIDVAWDSMKSSDDEGTDEEQEDGRPRK